MEIDPEIDKTKFCINAARAAYNTYFAKVHVFDDKDMEDDLRQEGFIRAYEAFDRWRKDGGRSLYSWCVYHARYGMSDFLRDYDHLPISMRRVVTQQLKEDESMTIPNQVRSAISLDAYMNVKANDSGESIAIKDTLLGELDSGFEEVEASLTNHKLLNYLLTHSKLTDRELIVLTLYFFEGLTLLEISQVFGFTESRASQLVSHSLHKLSQTVRKNTDEGILA